MRCQPDPIRLRLVDVHIQLGAGFTHPVIEVFDAGNVGDLRLDAPRVILQTIQIGSIKLDLERTRGAREIVDDVGENLDELDAQPRDGGLDLHTHLVDHLENRARALSRRPEPGDDISSILRRCEQSQLGAGAS